MVLGIKICINILIEQTMAIRLLLSISLILIFGAAIKAQTIRGKIVDDKQLPIDGATVILQTRDSIYIDAVISNADGSFLFNHHPEEYCLTYNICCIIPESWQIRM